jgi:hypothetical protein
MEAAEVNWSQEDQSNSESETKKKGKLALRYTNSLV